MEMPDESLRKKLWKAENANDFANEYRDGLDRKDNSMFEGGTVTALRTLGLKKIELTIVITKIKGTKIKETSQQRHLSWLFSSNTKPKKNDQPV
jgi:hypothetical protein